MTELTSRRALLAKLTGVLVRQRAVLFVSGVMLTAAAVTAAAIGLSLWANVMILPVAVKLPVLIAVGAGTLYLGGTRSPGCFRGRSMRWRSRWRSGTPSSRGG